MKLSNDKVSWLKYGSGPNPQNDGFFFICAGCHNKFNQFPTYGVSLLPPAGYDIAGWYCYICIEKGERMDAYQKQVSEHHKRVARAEHTLLETLQSLCPGYWVISIQATQPEMGKCGYRVAVSNGDDNVTAEAGSIGAATAKVIYHLLDGAVFPLGGNGGALVHPANREESE